MNSEQSPNEQFSASATYHGATHQGYPHYQALTLRVGFGRRFGAYLMDGLYIMIASILLYFGAMHINPTWVDGLASSEEFNLSTNDDNDDEEREAQLDNIKEMAQKLYVVVLFSSLITLPYSMIELRTGVSPGKYVLGIKVAGLYGEQANMGLLARRWLVKNSGSLLGVFAFSLSIGILDTLATLMSLGVIFGCFLVLTPERMALHDLGAGTAVFRKEDVIE
jgi:uncharacterized RDD family membrane protein YckC